MENPRKDALLPTIALLSRRFVVPLQPGISPADAT
jgi:hypothetical protein